MKHKISILILLCLTILASGIAAAQVDYTASLPAADPGASLATGLATGQTAALAACPQYGQAATEGTFGTKVLAGDSDVGLPLSAFSPFVGGTGGGVTAQSGAFLSFWDVGATPGLFDNQDVVYLQFGSAIGLPQRIVRANNIRMTGWGNYPAGSYVKQGDSDIGQQLLPWLPATFPVPAVSFAYVEVDGGQGYGLGDPVYLNLAGPVVTGTNDVRVTSFAGFPAGSKVSDADSDASRTLINFHGPFPPGTAGPLPSPVGPIAALTFFNANGNIINVPPAFQPIYDDGDVVYLDVTPVGFVSPNDVRLY